MVEQIVTQLAQAEGVTETMKENDPQRWTGLMNNFKHNSGGTDAERSDLQLTKDDGKRRE